jgi:hypothetical protein
VSTLENHEALMDLARDLANQIQRQLMAQKLPPVVISLACRIVARIGEAGIQQNGAEDLKALYRDAYAALVWRTDEKLRAANVAPPTMLEGGPLALDKPTFETDPDRLSHVEMASQAERLCQELARIMIAAGYSQEVGLLAAGALVHISEAVLKQEGPGDTKSAARYAKYLLALPLMFEQIDKALVLEVVPTRSGS